MKGCKYFARDCPFRHQLVSFEHLHSIFILSCSLSTVLNPYDEFCYLWWCRDWRHDLGCRRADILLPMSMRWPLLYSTFRHRKWRGHCYLPFVFPSNPCYLWWRVIRCYSSRLIPTSVSFLDANVWKQWRFSWFRYEPSLELTVPSRYWTFYLTTRTYGSFSLVYTHFLSKGCCYWPSELGFSF